MLNKTFFELSDFIINEEIENLEQNNELKLQYT